MAMVSDVRSAKKRGSNSHRHCCVPGCRNNGRYDEENRLSFHLFPKDEQLRKRWILKVGRKEGPLFKKITRGTLVCSDHFLPSDFKRSLTGLKRELRKGTIPSIFNVTVNKPKNRRISPKKRVKHSELKIEIDVAEHALLSGKRGEYVDYTDQMIEESGIPVGLKSETGATDRSHPLETIIKTESSDEGCIRATTVNMNTKQEIGWKEICSSNAAREVECNLRQRLAAQSRNCMETSFANFSEASVSTSVASRYSSENDSDFIKQVKTESDFVLSQKPCTEYKGNSSLLSNSLEQFAKHHPDTDLSLEHISRNIHLSNHCVAPSFTSQKLKSQVQITTEASFFKCIVCGVTFRYSFILKRHMLQHSGQKSYRYSVGQAGFRESPTLKRHTLI